MDQEPKLFKKTKSSTFRERPVSRLKFRAAASCGASPRSIAPPILHQRLPIGSFFLQGKTMFPSQTGTVSAVGFGRRNKAMIFFFCESRTLVRFGDELPST